jgi:hypothetical protein
MTMTNEHRRDVKRVVVYFDNGHIQDIDLEHGWLRVADNVIPGEPGVTRDEQVVSMTLGGRVARLINHPPAESYPPQSIPEKPEVANGIDN